VYRLSVVGLPRFWKNGLLRDKAPCNNGKTDETKEKIKMKAKIGQLGRSMVEMLGVLAIVGVLSVGGIAGYQKAVFKHRLNVFAQGVNFLIMNALDLIPKLDKNPDTETYYSKIFQQLGLIPDGFSYLDETYILDNMGNKLLIYYSNSKWGFKFSFTPSSNGTDICRNIISIIKEYHDNLWLVVYHFYNADTKKMTEGNFYGDLYCNDKDKKCISSVNLLNQDNLCNLDNQKSSTLYVFWK